MPDVVVTAHVRLREAEVQAAVLRWFEEAGLDVCYGEGSTLIAWIDEALPAFPEASALAVEVQCYPLSAEAFQVRWIFRQGSFAPVSPLVRELARSLREALRADGRWRIDPSGPPAAGRD